MNTGRVKRRIPRGVLAASVVAVAVVLGVLAAVVVRPGVPWPGPVPTPVPTATSSAEPPGPIGEPGPFTETIRRVGSGAHQMVATTCSGTGIGTAYQFGTEGLLVTAVRSVSGARAIAIVSGDRVVPAEVAKIDSRAGLALLKPATRMNGHTFVLGTTQLAVGDEVAAIGWTAQGHKPVQGQLHGAVGPITETGVTVSSPDGHHTVRRMAGEFDPGLAGSPVVDTSGHLLGMLVQGTPDQRELHVAGVDTIADALLGPTGRPPALEPCLSSTGPEVPTRVAGPTANATRTGLGTWYSALNAGEWDRARGVLSGELQGEWQPDQLSGEYAGTYHFNLVEATEGSATTVTWVRLGPEKSCVRGATEFTLAQGRITGMARDGDPVPCG